MTRPIHRIALAAAVLGLSLAATSAHTQVAVPPVEGVYRNATSDGGRTAIEAGTDVALADARRVVRALARPRLLENNPPVDRLVIEIEGDRARVSYDEDRSYHGVIGGAPIAQRAPDGSDVDVRYEIEGDALVEIAEASQGSARIRYEREGEALVVRTVIESRRLPAPVRFELRFIQAR